METLVLTNLSAHEIRQLLRDELKAYFKETKETEQSPTYKHEQILNIREAAEFLSLSVPTLYSKVSKGELPVMKRGKRLYFSSDELLEYLKAGRKKTNAEIEKEAEAYLLNNKKG
ncbi:MAG TPA: helix-turn-helix domain-containing protein [Bacteroidales bacterium]|nr:helix-turn-helix domain-containing protein [Bacteroidales bacterium]